MSDIASMLEYATQVLRAECIRRTGSFHMLRSGADKIRLAAPGLMPGGHIGKVQMNDLVRAFYSADEVELRDILSVWQEFVQGITYATPRLREMYAEAVRVFPRVPFQTMRGMDPAALMVQFMIAASWHVGRLAVTSNSAVLYLDEGRLAVYRQSIEWPEGLRRLRAPITFNPQSCLTVSLGEPHTMKYRLSSMYRYLVTTLPDMANQVQTLVSVANHCGKEHAEILTDAFDLERVPGVERPEMDIWDEALRTVDRAMKHPWGCLRSLLVPQVLSQRSFVAMFGRHIPHRTGFTPAERKRCRTSIVRAQAEHIKQASGVNNDSALEMIQLQRLLGGSA